MTIETQGETSYWDSLAIGVEKEKAVIRTEKWRNAAKNWLAYYVENKAREFIVDTIATHVRLNDDAQILDVGCGPGRWVKLFVEKGFATTGIDSSPWMIRLAKQNIINDNRSIARFSVMNVAKLELPSDFYDLVNCVTVLQHIFNDEEWKRAVYEIVRVVKPCGYVLIFEAAPSFVLGKRTRYLRFRTMKEYISEFEKAGACFVHWKATDLSFPITFMGLRKYAASFEEKVYYFVSREPSLISPGFLSLLSRIASILAKPIDYKFAETPLSLLSIGKILLFRKAKE